MRAEVGTPSPTPTIHVILYVIRIYNTSNLILNKLSVELHDRFMKGFYENFSGCFSRWFTWLSFFLSTKRHGGSYYVQFRLEDSSLTHQKSTGTSNTLEA